MLTEVIPKLPMRNKRITKEFYIKSLGFKELGDYRDYLLLKKETIEIHFFEFKNLNPKENYGQVYIRVLEIEKEFQLLIENNITIHPNGYLETKPWGQIEFSLLDPDNNLLTFGESLKKLQ
jgi:hypothetical protein